jgi:hypothetical protein
MSSVHKLEYRNFPKSCVNASITNNKTFILQYSVIHTFSSHYNPSNKYSARCVCVCDCMCVCMYAGISFSPFPLSFHTYTQRNFTSVRLVAVLMQFQDTTVMNCRMSVCCINASYVVDKNEQVSYVSV